MKVLKIQLFLYVPTYDCPYNSQTLSYLCKGLLFRLPKRMPKEIEIIHRLFLVIASYCQASSSQFN